MQQVLKEVQQLRTEQQNLKLSICTKQQAGVLVVPPSKPSDIRIPVTCYEELENLNEVLEDDDVNTKYVSNCM
jgi:hypothetical protein